MKHGVWMSNVPLHAVTWFLWPQIHHDQVQQQSAEGWSLNPKVELPPIFNVNCVVQIMLPVNAVGKPLLRNEESCSITDHPLFICWLANSDFIKAKWSCIFSPLHCSGFIKERWESWYCIRYFLNAMIRASVLSIYDFYSFYGLY